MPRYCTRDCFFDDESLDCVIFQSNKITRHTILFEACMCINACSDAQFVQIKNVGLIAEFQLVAVKCHKTVLVAMLPLNSVISPMRNMA